MKNKLNEDFNLIAFNSYGGFTEDGNEYHILNTKTPLPWCNILSNENFGSIISNSGIVYTYFKNSREFKLTNWQNDWTNVVPGEKFNGIFDKDYNLNYGFGYVKVNQIDDEVSKNMDIFVPINNNLKVCYIELENLSNVDKEIVIEYILDPVLGVSGEIDSSLIISKVENNTLLLKNPYSKYFGNCSAYVKAIVYSNKNNYNISYDNEKYSTSVSIKLSAKEKFKFCIILGAIEENIDNLNDIIEKYSDLDNLIKEYKYTKEYWKNKVKRNFSTGDKYIDIMANGWLLYQTISCRLFAKSGFYQSGGAIGFRDQLQDSMALISSWPEKTKSQIILHSSKQFEKGDVLHWWDAVTNAGIKTYFSDDYLWLPYVVCEYVSKTLDISVLDEVTTYLENKEMGNSREIYEVFSNSEAKDTVYEHCKKSINYGLSRINIKNGLLDIGDGDWNDGFSSIRGQSVWLTLFMINILDKFVKICKIKNDNIMVDICEKK